MHEAANMLQLASSLPRENKTIDQLPTGKTTNSQSVHKDEPVPLSCGKYKKQCVSAGLQQISRSTW